MANVKGFKKAKRENIWIKVLLAGSSGSGKSYSALRLATGISKQDGGRIAAIDTEHGRIRYYANEFDFDDLQIEEPYSPEKYMEAIDMAIEAGYKTLIIDSMSHEWTYCLDVHNKMPGNSYTNWAKVTPRHDAFMEKVLQSPINIIATVRGKDEYVLEEKNGKQVPKKIGLGYIQRDGMEYNYTLTFNLDQSSHIAEATKDNTHLFENKYEVLTEKDGVQLFNWANSGVEATKNVLVGTGDNVETDSSADELKEIIKGIIIKCGELGGTKNDDLMVTLKKYVPSGNPNAIKDLDKAKELMAEINLLTRKETK